MILSTSLRNPKSPISKDNPHLQIYRPHPPFSPEKHHHKVPTLKHYLEISQEGSSAFVLEEEEMSKVIPFASMTAQV